MFIAKFLQIWPSRPSGHLICTSLPDQLPAVLESCVVNDPLSPPGPPCIPDSLCEASSENTMVTSKLKESGM
ncbi:hypothetical protein Nepgr_033895 [Nepenthes gracilis]|uniref:Uncharacterized protein n=1 Tax=Nepenthes gracilis TaxID=150966 RepID=A0AAD3TMM9_NEPGR|nr:hypothetical protein Nepgr_033895 [Nepenthes gracilis]